jgi:tetratricopeptide (TPR) repeat protein
MMSETICLLRYIFAVTYSLIRAPIYHCYHSQSHDVRYHDGGTLQPLALEAFQKALATTDDDRIKYQVQMRMGMLLKMIGRGEEAVRAHEAAYRLAMGVEEKADALVQHANALGMIGGDLGGPISLLERALRVYPKGVATYYHLVSTRREQNILSKEEWLQLVGDMEKALKSLSKEPVKTLNLSISPDIYWAMFLALEAAGRLAEAWAYLEIAHAATIASRDRVTTARAIEEQLQQVQAVFGKSFFPEPNNVGSQSKVPVFIIGMMRLVILLIHSFLYSGI